MAGTKLPDPPITTKLQEQTTGKADLSYSSWANHAAAQAGPAPLAEPRRKLTEEEALQLERQQSASGASAWNHAGTFEEKSVGEWGRTWVKTNLLDVRHGSVRIDAVTTVEGDANIWFVRGKLRHGFDFVVQLSWKADVAAKGTLPAPTEISGTIKIPNACLDDIDELVLEVEVLNRKPERAAEETAAAREAAAMVALFTAKFKAFHTELKLKQ